MNTESETLKHRAPFGRFFLAIAAQLAAILALYAILAPKVFTSETSRPWSLLLWMFLLGLPISLFEYFYHRYLLHSAVLPFMGSMHRAHSTHHGLTNVKAPVTPNEPAKLVEVHNEFPIEQEHQEESMMFPLWSLPIFVALFLVLFGLPLKLMFPGAPVLLATIGTGTLYIVAYEVWHAVLHLPFDRFWQPSLRSRWAGGLARHTYGFHLMHHWRPTSNLAIVGFWGVAVWDYAFLTHRRPERMPLKGAEVNFHDAKLKKPLWPISLLDRWQGGLYRASRSTERFFARVFLRRPA
ncbi:MAG TPA: hypothetical protein VKT78_19880 [Fimbriimonadaceae bacterium]|nr:hypothetical protein [Fimbriimonadaceae bacterium]